MEKENHSTMLVFTAFGYLDDRRCEIVRGTILRVVTGQQQSKFIEVTREQHSE